MAQGRIVCHVDLQVTSTGPAAPDGPRPGLGGRWTERNAESATPFGPARRMDLDRRITRSDRLTV